MEYDDIHVESLSKSNPRCSADFVIPNSDTYIELKYRQIKQNTYDNLLLDVTKIARWKRELPHKLTHIAFGFIYKEYCFTKYSEDVFNCFKTSS